MSNYPPGFGSSWDLDNVEGPVSEQEIEDECPKCGLINVLARQYWRSGPPTVYCNHCDYHVDEDYPPEY